MRKKIALILAVTMMMTLLAGCGKKDSDNSSAETAENVESVEDTDVSVDESSENGDASVVGSNDPAATEIEHWTFIDGFINYYATMADSWNEEHPDQLVRMNIHVLPYDDMHNKLQIALNSGTGAPDSADVEIAKFANFVEGESQLIDLTEYVEPYRGSVVESRLGLYSRDGKVYGYPTHVGATVAFYNVELLEEAGIDYTAIKTWDDFKEAGSKYYEATGKAFGNLDTGSNMFFNVIIAQMGADYLDSDGNLSVNNEGIVAALKLMRELQEANAVSITPGGTPDCDEGYGAYNNGDFAAMIMPLWMSNRFTSYMTDMQGKIAVAPVPTLNGAETMSVCGGGNAAVVTRECKDPDVAAAFIAYAKLSPLSSKMTWLDFGMDPLNMEVWTDEEVINDKDSVFSNFYVNDALSVLNEVKGNIILLNSQATKYYPSISNTFNTVVFNAVFENGDDIQETLDFAQLDLENEFGL